MWTMRQSTRIFCPSHGSASAWSSDRASDLALPAERRQGPGPEVWFRWIVLDSVRVIVLRRFGSRGGGGVPGLARGLRRRCCRRRLASSRGRLRSMDVALAIGMDMGCSLQGSGPSLCHR